jgi:hypothetical protein
MAITTQREINTVGLVDRLAGVPKASEVLVKGSLVVIDAGYFAKPTDAANKYPVGIYEGVECEPGNDSYTAPSSGMPTVTVARGKIWVPFTGAAQADVGLLFYLADNGTVTKTAGSKTWSVPAVGFKAGYVLLDFNQVHGAAA